jgi:hypothetical protein
MCSSSSSVYSVSRSQINRDRLLSTSPRFVHRKKVCGFVHDREGLWLHQHPGWCLVEPLLVQVLFTDLQDPLRPLRLECAPLQYAIALRPSSQNHTPHESSHHCRSKASAAASGLRLVQSSQFRVHFTNHHRLSISVLPGCALLQQVDPLRRP